MLRTTTSLFVVAAVLLTPVFAAAGSSSQLFDGPIVDELRQGQTTGDDTFDHSTYDALLDRHVDMDAGTVDYAGVKRDHDELQQYLGELADADLTSLGADEQLALLINVYNGCTLDLIVDHYPGIDSIRDISSPWDIQRCEVGGHTLTLDQVEHEIIRPMYRDPRIHFAVNCAAVDCPPLADFAYQGARIDDQLRARTEAVLSDEQFVRTESRLLFGDRLRFTRVMHWYEDDFVDDQFKGHADTVAAYIGEHTQDDELGAFIEDHDGDPPARPLRYDWSLNDSN